MSQVQGKNVVLYVFDQTWKLYACGRSCVLDRVTDYIETSVSGSGLWRTFKPTANSWTISSDGITYLAEAGQWTLSEFDAYQGDQGMILMRMQRTDNSGNVFTSEGIFFITRLTDTGNYNDVATFQFEGRGTGLLSRITVITPNPLNSCKVKRYDYTGTGDEDSFTSALLIGKDILEVVKDGLGKASIITGGTPVNIEAKYTTSTGKIQFANPFAPGEKAYVLFQDI